MEAKRPPEVPTEALTAAGNPAAPTDWHAENITGTVPPHQLLNAAAALPAATPPAPKPNNPRKPPTTTGVATPTATAVPTPLIPAFFLSSNPLYALDVFAHVSFAP
eukprot:TRINITY_DN754_c0_g1_i2.p2 TRINITY_DN754_c0_g1~~TRINITY_DN754_c0_g1_i2.p2  ORF type:complete len:106 (-),score=17.16 TRINITY_DN754_c0_g1_i2:455-772(-)